MMGAMRSGMRTGWLRLAAILFFLCALGLVFGWGYTRLRRSVVERHVEAAAAQYGVEARLVRAVIRQESGFRPHERGKSGELGLMQITEAAAWELIRNRFSGGTGTHPLEPV